MFDYIRPSRSILDNGGNIRIHCVISDFDGKASMPSLLLETDSFCHIQ